MSAYLDENHGLDPDPNPGNTHKIIEPSKNDITQMKRL
jgi:hypothetical protein